MVFMSELEWLLFAHKATMNCDPMKMNYEPSKSVSFHLSPNWIFFFILGLFESQKKATWIKK